VAGVTITTPREDTMKKLALGALALVTAFALLQPTEAEAQRWRHGGRGAGVAAGVAAGIIGGAFIAGATRRSYYGGPMYVAPGPFPGPVYVEPGYAVAPRCWIVRRSLFDEYGQLVAYRRQLVCG
jgi:hypothetical protein